MRLGLISALTLTLALGATASPAPATAAPDNSPDFAQRCAALAAESISGTDVQSAVMVEASTATVPGQTLALPSYCRVRAVVRPAIHVEVRLPVESVWNGR